MIPHADPTRKPRIHHVRSWSWLFDPINAGRKTHDLRIDDRDYAVGDLLVLNRYDPERGQLTGEQCTVEITYITSRDHPCAFSSAVLSKDYVILSIRKLND